MSAPITTNVIAPFPAAVENAAARGRIVLVCEHASNAFPAPWGNLGLSQDQQNAPY